MRCRLNQEMILATNSQKQLFDNNMGQYMDNMELHFKLQSPTCSCFAVTGLCDSQALASIVLYLTRKERLGQKKISYLRN